MPKGPAGSSSNVGMLEAARRGQPTNGFWSPARSYGRAAHPSPRSGAFRKMGCCSRGPWSAFPWSWRPPRSCTGKTKVVGLVELSMPAPLHHAHHDGITSYHLALCDPPAGGPTYCRPLSGCRLPEARLTLLCRSVSTSPSPVTTSCSCWEN